MCEQGTVQHKGKSQEKEGEKKTIAIRKLCDQQKSEGKGNCKVRSPERIEMAMGLPEPMDA